MTRVESRLRLLRPYLMDFYDRRRAGGVAPAEAMRAAAFDAWHAANAGRAGPREHGAGERVGLRQGAAGKALAPGGSALDELDAAVRREVGELAAHISPEALDRLQRQWRSAGLVPAADAAGLLAQVAREAHAQGLMPSAAAGDLIATADRAAANQRKDRLDRAGAAARRASSPTMSVQHADGHPGRDAQRERLGRAFPPLTHVRPTQLHTGASRAGARVPAPRRGRTR
jgi:hypothetical protein